MASPRSLVLESFSIEFSSLSVLSAVKRHGPRGTGSNYVPSLQETSGPGVYRCSPLSYTCFSEEEVSGGVQLKDATILQSTKDCDHRLLPATLAHDSRLLAAFSFRSSFLQYKSFRFR